MTLSRPLMLLCLALAAVSATAQPVPARPTPPAGSRLSQADWARQCEERLRPTRIFVRSQAGGVRYDQSLPASALADMTPPDNLPLDPRVVPVGLTESRFVPRIELGDNYIVEPATGRACMRPELTLTLSVSPQLVHIASELTPNGCAYRQVAQQELKHVRVNQEALDAAAEELEVTLREAFGNQVYYGTQAELDARLRRSLDTDWLPLVFTRLNETAVEHQHLANAGQYARTFRACNAEVPRALGLRPLP